MTEEQLLQFKTEGYTILEGVIPPDEVAMIREELDTFIGVADEELDRLGVDKLHLNHRGKRYFIGNQHSKSEPLERFVYGDLMASICRQTLGENAYFFLEQFVVKTAD